MNRNELVLGLTNGSMVVRFTKLNGEERIMTCTLNESLIPKDRRGILKSEKDREIEKTDADKISVWDLNAVAWRAFIPDTVISASVV